MINNLNFDTNNNIIMNNPINNNIGIINVPYPNQNMNLFANNNIQEINYIPNNPNSIINNNMNNFQNEQSQI